VIFGPDDIVAQLRKIASRGRMDDADVQIIFDAADEIDRLRSEVDRLRQRRYELVHEVAELRQERTT
jgi:uncharacterized coiled-coil DUF342 family protein